MGKSNYTQEVKKATEEALAGLERQIVDLKVQEEAKKAIEAAANAGEEAVKKGKSWADVKKAMDDAFEKAREKTKNFGKDVWEKISKIYEAFIARVEKAWKKVFDLVYRKEKVSKGEKGYTYKVPDKAEVEKEEKERKAGIEALKQEHREKRKKVRGLIEYKPEESIEDSVVDQLKKARVDDDIKKNFGEEISAILRKRLAKDKKPEKQENGKDDLN